MQPGRLLGVLIYWVPNNFGEYLIAQQEKSNTQQDIARLIR